MKKRFAAKDITCFMTIMLIALAFATLYSTNRAGAEGKKFLADKHQAKSIACASCHKESPPKVAVGTATCFTCHGSYAKIAEKTINVSPNPHASHMGELACETCHHAHKQSENQCGSCHEFPFKVP